MSTNGSFEFRIPFTGEDANEGGNNNCGRNQLFYSLFRTILNHVLYTRTLIPVTMDDLFSKCGYLFPSSSLSSPESASTHSSSLLSHECSTTEQNREECSSDDNGNGDHHASNEMNLDLNDNNNNNTHNTVYQVPKRLSSSERKMKKFLIDYHHIMTIIKHLFIMNASSSSTTSGNCMSDESYIFPFYVINGCHMSIKNMSTSSHPKENVSIHFPSSTVLNEKCMCHNQKQQQSQFKSNCNVTSHIVVDARSGTPFSSSNTKIMNAVTKTIFSQQQQQQQFYCRQLTRKLLSEWSEFHVPAAASSNNSHTTNTSVGSKRAAVGGLMIKTMMSKLFVTFRITVFQNKINGNLTNSNIDVDHNNDDSISHVMTQMRSIPYFSDYFTIVTVSSDNNVNSNIGGNDAFKSIFPLQQPQLNESNNNTLINQNLMNNELSSSSPLSSRLLNGRTKSKLSKSSSSTTPGKSVLFTLTPPPPLSVAVFVSNTHTRNRMNSNDTNTNVNGTYFSSFDTTADESCHCDNNYDTYTVCCCFDIVLKRGIQGITGHI